MPKVNTRRLIDWAVVAAMVVFVAFVSLSPKGAFVHRGADQASAAGVPVEAAIFITGATAATLPDRID